MVRPIDGQHLILQTNAIEKLQQVHQQQSNIQQNYIEMQLQEEKKLAREVIQDSSETEKASIKERESDRRKKDSKRNRNLTKFEEDEREIEADMESEGKGNFINIKV
ncbi:hypothetical protein SAMN04489760_11188 [Syntrophus gentianae]|uniref:Uncharacterized protein n=1 Tax=Syntrophus gentianae TaxID=43775 RepID=A0A1H7XPG3_9BACT|nr:hypothetical protein [Syntrophus gentianae]SEM35524.1 hypothetical protein SAMN04489760_11188 [Syntrophus gentianae]